LTLEILVRCSLEEAVKGVFVWRRIVAPFLNPFILVVILGLGPRL
jgi:hypothetical protein